MADDIHEADMNKVDDGRRERFMAEKGDEWLLKLFCSEREHTDGTIKNYLDHDAVHKHD